MHPTIKTKRIYDAPAKTDGARILIDRLWPRGMKKEEAHIKEWAKDIAPSKELREWYHQHPESWPEFEKKYKAELKHNPAVDAFLEKYEGEKTLTLLYAKKDDEHNNALVLQEWLEHEFNHR